ncbi:hypothetical protein JAAARDRAFT_193470 [Jaapia argillacea MUCL 33604]|uniref:DUF7514 domain-containing protein n=1 Tax=Jaapia argillacea MUCL 33604 TaxID=933084 RepID=A0A067PVU9_9AGAM|nr:hypothetical protein JAAARDRAFT_193470 [Jaapia argillacea MUCL 33604]
MGTGQYTPPPNPGPGAFGPPYRHAQSVPPLGNPYPQIPRHSSSFSAGQYQTGPPTTQIPNRSWGASPTSAGPSPSTSGYAPVQYDSPYGGGDFYGSLIDANGRPSQILARLADALFFYMDQCCDVVQLRGTKKIEPAKISWLALKMGEDQASADATEELLQSYYDAGSIPYTIGVVNGRQVPVLDRRGFLHMVVYDSRAIPVEEHKYWSKVLNMFRLTDPATRQPFPTPIPRSAFPISPDMTLSLSYNNWRMQAARVIGTRKAQAAMSQFGKPAAAVAAGGATGVSADYLAQLQGMAGSGASAASGSSTGPSLATAAKFATSAYKVAHHFMGNNNNSTSNQFGTTPSFDPNSFGMNSQGFDPNSFGLNNQGFDPSTLSQFTNPGGFDPSSLTGLVDPNGLGGLADPNMISGLLDPNLLGNLYN